MMLAMWQLQLEQSKWSAHALVWNTSVLQLAGDRLAAFGFMQLSFDAPEYMARLHVCIGTNITS